MVWVAHSGVTRAVSCLGRTVHEETDHRQLGEGIITQLSPPRAASPDRERARFSLPAAAIFVMPRK